MGIIAALFIFIDCVCDYVLLDANVLVPLLFAETMDLHPIVIILSVLVFGGLWGFWGDFLQSH
jgi:Domain of unknown function DUF20.